MKGKGKAVDYPFRTPEWEEQRSLAETFRLAEETARNDWHIKNFGDQDFETWDRNYADLLMTLLSIGEAWA